MTDLKQKQLARLRAEHPEEWTAVEWNVLRHWSAESAVMLHTIEFKRHQARHLAFSRKYYRIRLVMGCCNSVLVLIFLAGAIITAQPSVFVYGNWLWAALVGFNGYSAWDDFRAWRRSKKEIQALKEKHAKDMSDLLTWLPQPPTLPMWMNR